MQPAESQFGKARGGRKSGQPLRRARGKAARVRDRPEILGIKLSILEHHAATAIQKAEIGATAVANVIDLLEVVAAVALINVHMDMPRTASLLSEEDRLGWLWHR